jgi:type I restriction enzyme S subunit
MPKGSVLISITRYIRPTILEIDACANQSVVGIFESRVFKKAYLYPYFKNQVKKYMTVRTGANQPHINKETIDASPILRPPDHILDGYCSTATTFYNQIANNAFQNFELSQLRDWLLPMLMNEQVRLAGQF